MINSNYKFKLSETGNKGNLNTPQFSLSYKAYKRADNQIVSYNVISALKEDNDVVIEVNSALIINMKRKKNIQPENFLHEIRNLNLNHTVRNIQIPDNQNVFSMFFGGKKEEKIGHEIMVYVPDKIWKGADFYKLLPDYGVRYYILNGTADSKSVLDDMGRMQDNEKVENFRLILFDVASYNQMGIVSSKFTADNIKNILK